jgi:hypothetical protein
MQLRDWLPTRQMLIEDAIALLAAMWGGIHYAVLVLFYGTPRGMAFIPSMMLGIGFALIFVGMYRRERGRR